MKKHESFEPISDEIYRKLSSILNHSYESNILATELGKIICARTRERQKKTNKAEYARSVVVQILKNESVEDTIIAGCGCTIEEMFLEAEEKLRKILEEKGRNTENEKTLH